MAIQGSAWSGVTRNGDVGLCECESAARSTSIHMKEITEQPYRVRRAEFAA
jgi:hypothetical protein